MSKAESFKKWYAERQGHPPQIKAALEALIELEQSIEVLKSIIDKSGCDHECVPQIKAGLEAIIELEQSIETVKNLTDKSECDHDRGNL